MVMIGTIFYYLINISLKALRYAHVCSYFFIKSYLVYLKLDNKGRIVGSSKLDYFLDKSPITYQEGDEVNLLIAETTELGNKVIINDAHWGLVHSPDIFQTLSYGKKIKGYIKHIRDDGKIDVVLRKIGQDSIHELADRILLCVT